MFQLFFFFIKQCLIFFISALFYIKEEVVSEIWEN